MRKTVPLAIAVSALLVSAIPASAMTSDSPSAWTHARNELDIGVDLIQHGKIEESLVHLDAALDQYPKDTDILKYLGYAHRMLAKHRTGTARDTELRLADDYYRRALDIDPNAKDFLEYMGEVYLQMDDLAAARGKLTALDGLCPAGCAQRDALAQAIAAYSPPPVAKDLPSASPSQ